MLDLGLVEEAGIDADLLIEAFDLEADDAVQARPREEAEQEETGVGQLATGADLAPALDLAPQ